MDKTQVWLSTFKYPGTANNTYTLMPEFDRIYRESGSITILGIKSNFAVSPYLVFLIYMVNGEYGRVKVMTTQMDTSTNSKTYYVTPAMGLIKGFIQSQQIFSVDMTGSYFMYGGSTNFIQGTGTQNAVVIDYSRDTNKSFGFMMVWSADPTCRTQTDKDALTFGEQFAVTEPGLELMVA